MTCQSNTITSSATPQHTPGPFAFYRDSEGVDDLWIIESATTQQCVASITFWDSADDWMTRATADACLLSAAPDLLQALKQMLAVVAEIPGGLSVAAYEAEQLAFQAIAKAEGRD